jgi:hypothetical protein
MALKDKEMKTFRMIGMALFAVLMCVNFASCDTDGDGSGGSTSTNAPGNGGNGGKRLVKFMRYDVVNGQKKLDESVEFVYGANGNVVKTIEGWSSEYNGEWKTDTYEYVWDSNKSFTIHWDEEESEQFVLDNGRTAKIVYLDEDYVEIYYLNYANGNIKEYGELLEGGVRDTYYTYSWIDGKLTSVSAGNEMTTFLYDGKTCKAFFPLLCQCLEGFDETYNLIAQPELVGAKMTYLPTEMTTEYSAMTFKYEFDSEGYLIGCSSHETFDYSSSADDCYYAFFWE